MNYPPLAPAEYRKALEETPISATFVIVSIVTDIDPSTYGVESIDTFYTDTADIHEMLAPDDPERSMISVQFPEFHDASRDSRHFGMQLVALASFEYQGRWATGQGAASSEEYAELIVRDGRGS